MLYLRVVLSVLQSYVLASLFSTSVGGGGAFVLIDDLSPGFISSDKITQSWATLGVDVLFCTSLSRGAFRLAKAISLSVCADWVTWSREIYEGSQGWISIANESSCFSWAIRKSLTSK